MKSSSLPVVVTQPDEFLQTEYKLIHIGTHRGLKNEIHLDLDVKI